MSPNGRQATHQQGDAVKQEFDSQPVGDATRETEETGTEYILAKHSCAGKKRSGLVSKQLLLFEAGR
jgi:hypothetical protein